MVQKIEPKFLCRDNELYREFEEDSLCHDTGTLEGLAGMLQRAEDLDSEKFPSNSLEGCSLWVGHGVSVWLPSLMLKRLCRLEDSQTDDRVTSFKATARFMERILVQDKTFRIYDGHYHKRTINPCHAGAFLLTPSSAR